MFALDLIALEVAGVGRGEVEAAVPGTILEHCRRPGAAFAPPLSQ